MVSHDSERLEWSPMCDERYVNSKRLNGSTSYCVADEETLDPEGVGWPRDPLLNKEGDFWSTKMTNYSQVIETRSAYPSPSGIPDIKTCEI